MKKYSKSEIHNKGSATVEICLVMPLVLGIITSIIFLFVDAINDSVIRGQVYSTLYTYDVDAEEEEKLLLNINEHLIGVYTLEELDLGDEHGMVNVSISSEDVTGGKNHEYFLRNLEYCAEFGLSTSRLRRWQFYGDILQ